MLLTPGEIVALRYVGHIYLHMDRLATVDHHNSERRRRLLQRVHDETGAFVPGESILPWLEKRRAVLVAMRAEVRREIENLLQPFLKLAPESQVCELEQITPDWLFSSPLPDRVIASLKSSDKGARLSDLGLDVLDLAGRQMELEALLSDS